MLKSFKNKNVEINKNYLNPMIYFDLKLADYLSVLKQTKISWS